MQTLPEPLAGPDTKAPKDTEATERFTITDEKSATWYLRKLAAIEAEAEAIRAATAQRLAELASDRARLEHLFGSQLEAWARQEAECRRRRTVTLPLAGACIALRRVPSRLEMIDREAAADVALTLGMLKPPAADLLAYAEHARVHFEATGELLPGVGRSEERERVSIRRLGEQDPAPE